MKKLLLFFLFADLIFVAAVITIYSEKHRAVASLGGSAMTDGQNQKLELINSLHLIKSEESVALKTNMLQTLCATYSLIELKFKALDIAFSGQEPQITHTFSCGKIQAAPEQDTLTTLFSDLKLLRENPVFKTENSQLAARSLFRDEEFPSKWKLFELTVTGKENFSITEPELNQYLGDENFSFKITF